MVYYGVFTELWLTEVAEIEKKNERISVTQVYQSPVNIVQGMYICIS